MSACRPKGSPEIATSLVRVRVRVRVGAGMRVGVGAGVGVGVRVRVRVRDGHEPVVGAGLLPENILADPDRVEVRHVLYERAQVRTRVQVEQRRRRVRRRRAARAMAAATAARGAARGRLGVEDVAKPLRG